MVWQDMVIGGVSFMFLIGLLVQIRKSFRTKDTTAFSWTMILSTMIGMVGLTISMFSLDMVFSGTMNFAQFIAWSVLFFTKMVNENVHTLSDFKPQTTIKEDNQTVHSYRSNHDRDN
jgi:hypothetical protein